MSKALAFGPLTRTTPETRQIKGFQKQIMKGKDSMRAEEHPSPGSVTQTGAEPSEEKQKRVFLQTAAGSWTCLKGEVLVFFSIRTLFLTSITFISPRQVWSHLVSFWRSLDPFPISVYPYDGS